ncbi:Squamosa promoter-binding-like protein [Actinidia chinensis var. chinensis]|uniref:Squamosa promoter-binding-like protein n=1 Tax=Actinidia chinensis var. chinensis TaxID=1590841 RepID=A0A2R6RF09_ACTCC|nr:Squamosa promoter-binding-like protein [Actinidia chinensis var. chinensis]
MFEDSKFLIMESSGSSKRAKKPSNITHVVSCLVDGCNSDLSQCREYHRRHKVCEVHSKTAKVTIGGREQRFCQQCSRFHSLVEFDEGKRSCRKRLDCHNRRRRKPQSESLSKNTGRFFSSQQGTTLLSFSGPQLRPSALTNSAWAGAVKAENDGGVGSYNAHPCLSYVDRPGSFSGSLAQGFGGGNQFKLLQPQDNNHNSASKNITHVPKLFLDGLDGRVVDSDCALSLLSSVPAETREIGLSHVVQPSPIPYAHSVVHDMHYYDLSHYSQGIENKPVVSIFSSLVGDNTNNIHCQGMFQNGPDGPSASGSHQTLSFRWE